MRGLPVLFLCVLTVSCGRPEQAAQPPGLTLPDGDRIVRVQPGDCAENCIVVDSRYESVTTVEGRLRSDEQVGRDLSVSLARSGWVEVERSSARYAAGQVTYPHHFTRLDGDRRSYLELLPVSPGEYGLAYDEDGDTVSPD